MDSEGLIATFEQTLRKTRDAQTRLMSRLREVESEAERLRQEIQAMDNSASQTEAAILHLLATMRSGNQEWNGDKKFNLDGNYDLSEIQRQKQNDLNNQLKYNRENQANYRDDNRSNYRDDNHSNYRDDNHNYNRGTVAYMNHSRNIPTINPQREPISRRFENKTITDACSLLMREAGEPLHVNELYNMLVAGGMIFTGNNPTISIAVSLNRNKRFRKVAPGTFDLVMKDVSKKVS
jgi:hypothetical protein